MSSSCCISGHVHEGDPKGQIIDLHGRKTYVAEPPNGTAAKGIIIIVPDAFGLPFINNQLLADHYATKGNYKVYLPDFMDNYPSPVWVIDAMAEMADMPAVKDWSSLYTWLIKPYYVAITLYGFVPFSYFNRFDVSWPKVKKYFNDVRTNEGANLPIGAAGFCWGGRHAVYLAHDVKTKDGKPLCDASFIAHPSLVQVPVEIDLVVHPLSMAIGDQDFVCPPAETKRFKSAMEALKDVDTEVVDYLGSGHGFAVRADPKNKKQMEHSLEAEDQAISWFQKQFAKRPS